METVSIYLVNKLLDRGIISDKTEIFLQPFGVFKSIIYRSLYIKTRNRGLFSCANRKTVMLSGTAPTCADF